MRTQRETRDTVSNDRLRNRRNSYHLKTARKKPKAKTQSGAFKLASKTMKVSCAPSRVLSSQTGRSRRPRRSLVWFARTAALCSSSSRLLVFVPRGANVRKSLAGNFSSKNLAAPLVASDRAGAASTCRRAVPLDGAPIRLPSAGRIAASSFVSLGAARKILSSSRLSRCARCVCVLCVPCCRLRATLLTDLCVARVFGENLQLNISYPATGLQKTFDIDDEKKLYVDRAKFSQFFVVACVVRSSRANANRCAPAGTCSTISAWARK